MSCCSQSLKKESQSSKISPAATAKNDATLWLKLAIAVILAGLSMYLSLGTNLADPKGDTRFAIHSFLALLCLTAITALAAPLFGNAWRSIRAGEVTLEHAFLVGILGAFGASLYSTLSGQGAIYYEVVNVLIAIYLFGQTLTEKQIAKELRLDSLIPGLRANVTLVKDCGNEIVPSNQVKAGEKIQVTTGEIIPIDGVVADGSAYVEQQAHTGELYPQVKNQGDLVLAGSTLLDGELVILTTTDGDKREIDRLLHSLAASDRSSTRAEALAQRILLFFVPSVLAIAITTGLTWTLMGKPVEGWLNALTVTVVACPCALGIAIPLATQRGLANLKLLGILPKNADFFERLAEVDTVAFDKTGTLSSNQLELETLQILEGAPEHLTHWISQIQRQSSHPVARPFWRLSSSENSVLDDLQIRVLPGRGIAATFEIDGGRRELVIGNHLLLADLEMTTDRRSNDIRRLYVITNGKVIAIAHLIENAEQSSVAALRTLIANEYQVEILTGDSSIPEGYRLPKLITHMGQTSEEKGKLISRYSASRKLLYVGDGLNDCEGFQNAHASINIEGSHCSAASKVSQATLLHNDLSVIPSALLNARELKERLHRILLFSFYYNGTGITLAALGLLHPVAAALLMFASSFFVISRLGSTPKAHLAAPQVEKSN